MRIYDEGDIVEYHNGQGFGMMTNEGACVCERDFDRDTGHILYIVSISCPVHCKNYGTTWLPLDHDKMYPVIVTVMK